MGFTNKHKTKLSMTGKVFGVPMLVSMNNAKGANGVFDALLQLYSEIDLLGCLDAPEYIPSGGCDSGGQHFIYRGCFY